MIIIYYAFTVPEVSVESIKNVISVGQSPEQSVGGSDKY